MIKARRDEQGRTEARHLVYCEPQVMAGFIVPRPLPGGPGQNPEDHESEMQDYGDAVQF